MSFPFITGKAADNDQLSLFTEYAWDFEHDCFIYRDGKHVVLTGKEALKVWIYKALKTERNRHLVYSNDYGVELEQFIGTTPNNEEAAMEIERYVTEALLVNPYILRVIDINFTNDKDVLNYDLSLETVYGEVDISV